MGKTFRKDDANRPTDRTKVRDSIRDERRKKNDKRIEAYSSAYGERSDYRRESLQYN